jgi:2-oxo-4-hydroxy-4-carboxy-5-ureidoimidazoline decarboxylase
MEPWQCLDLAPPEEARRLLQMCCGATRWIERMLARRPYRDRAPLLDAAREEWFALSTSDWLEAFAQHPKIGDREALRDRFAATRHLSEQEQKRLNSASEAVLTALADGNRAYEAKFGYIFIVSATGRSAGEMLSLLRARLANDPDTEIQVAAAEQAKITELRLLGLRCGTGISPTSFEKLEQETSSPRGGQTGV